MNIEKQDVYTRITKGFIQGRVPCSRSVMILLWSAGNTEGRITRPLRHNGQRYSGINVLML